MLTRVYTSTYFCRIDNCIELTDVGRIAQNQRGPSVNNRREFIDDFFPIDRDGITSDLPVTLANTQIILMSEQRSLRFAADG